MHPIQGENPGFCTTFGYLWLKTNFFNPTIQSHRHNSIKDKVSLVTTTFTSLYRVAQELGNGDKVVRSLHKASSQGYFLTLFSYLPVPHTGSTSCRPLTMVPPTYETTFRQFSSNPRPTLLTNVNKRLDSMGNLDIMSEVWIRRDVLISDIDKVF